MDTLCKYYIEKRNLGHNSIVAMVAMLDGWKCGHSLQMCAPTERKSKNVEIFQKLSS